jgi:peptidoglycan/xylan/chitin deacetylase (PgdA/CDA1 family)
MVAAARTPINAFLSLRSTLRGPVSWGRSLYRRPSRTEDWIAVAMYHKMPSCDRRGFGLQLDYMSSLGEFVTATQLVELLSREEPLGGRYLCITFDDGELDAYQNAAPLLAERNIPATFFVVPDWVSSDIPDEEGNRRYVDWDECRALADYGFTIGSHSMTHRRLSALGDDQARTELVRSKIEVEEALGVACSHFACPWGQPSLDYIQGRDPELAEAAGYQSFFTTIRGHGRKGTSPWAIPRVRLEPGWGVSQLPYLFAR